jgi:hypothetical protein
VGASPELTDVDLLSPSFWGLQQLCSLHNLDIPRIAERYPGPTRRDVVYAERGQAEYKAPAEIPEALFNKASTTLFYNVRPVLNEAECTIQPATKGPEVASHRPRGVSDKPCSKPTPEIT